MEVRTSRFGTVEVADDRVITFPKGLLGFQQHKRYCLLQPSDDACFFWLQCVDDPTLAFVVTDPSLFVPDYTVPIRTEQMEDLRLAKAEDSQVFVIVNKVGGKLTANLQGPLVVNTLAKVGEQFVLAEKRWTTRHELLSLETAAHAVSA
ncbi:MAG: flagellar assembly protein FliW [Phycisphaerales bacterium]|nr:flagellar assembly protein FliW [Phycisphaerales bacterium]